MNLSIQAHAQLETLSDSDMDSVVGGEIGPVTPTIICPVGQTYDVGTGKCVANKLQFSSYGSSDE